MKYIIIDKGGLELPIVFNDKVENHNTVYRDNTKIVSAGYAAVTREGWYCYGVSISLGKVARPQDADILNKFLPLPDPY